MSFFATLASAIWPDSSDVDKADVRAWGATVEGFIDGLAWQAVVKQVDETKNSDASLADDDELVIALAANTKYQIKGQIWFDSDATPDFKWRHAGPSTPTLIWLARRTLIPTGTAYSAQAIDEAYSASDITVTCADTSAGLIEFDAIIHNAGNAGNFSVQWAQNTSNAAGTTVRAGSGIDWRKVTP